MLPPTLSAQLCALSGPWLSIASLCFETTWRVSADRVFSFGGQTPLQWLPSPCEQRRSRPHPGVLQIPRALCRQEELWLPKDTEARRDGDFVADHFPTFGRAQVAYVRRADGGSVLTPEAFDRALALHRLTAGVEWPNEGAEVPWLPSPVPFTDVCLGRNVNVRPVSSLAAAVVGVPFVLV